MSNKDFKIDDYLPTEETLREGFKAKFDQTWDEAQEQLSKKLVIGFMGTASSGKSSAIKSIFDIDPGEISPIPGSTKEVKVFDIDKNLTIIDCPGSQSQSSLKFEVAPLSWFTRRPLPPVSRLRFSVPFSAQA